MKKQEAAAQNQQRWFSREGTQGGSLTPRTLPVLKKNRTVWSTAYKQKTKNARSSSQLTTACSGKRQISRLLKNKVSFAQLNPKAKNSKIRKIPERMNQGRWHPKAFYETDKQPTGETGERREVKKKKLARCSKLKARARSGEA